MKRQNTVLFGIVRNIIVLGILLAAVLVLSDHLEAGIDVDAARKRVTTTAPSKKKVEPRRIVINTAIRAPGILRKANKLLRLAQQNTDDIEIIINSPGGAVFAGMQFINAMEAAKAKGITLRCKVPGIAASMAFQFFAHCTERQAMRYSLLLWHPVRVNGLMLLTPKSAHYLAWHLKEIEARMVPVLQDALQIPDGTFWFHYHNETLWTAEAVKEMSPDFLTIVDDMEGVGPIWRPGRMEGGQVTWEEIDKDTDPTPTPAPKSPPPAAPDCTTCHKKHGRR